MGKKNAFTAEQVAAAIREARGLQTAAAARLGCTRQTIARYIKKYETVRTAYEEANERQIDTAEAALFKQISEGNVTAIIFYLKTKGKKRGYVEKQEIDYTVPPEVAKLVRLMEENGHSVEMFFNRAIERYQQGGDDVVN